MKKIIFITLIFIGTVSFTDMSLKKTKPSILIENHAIKNSFKKYTLSGTFYIGIFAYDYTMVIDADICITCQPPYIHINNIVSLSVCLRNTTTCGSVGFTRIGHDGAGNLDFIEFTVEDIDNKDAIKNYMNDTYFQSVIKEKLLASEGE